MLTRARWSWWWRAIGTGRSNREFLAGEQNKTSGLISREGDRT